MSSSIYKSIIPKQFIFARVFNQAKNNLLKLKQLSLSCSIIFVRNRPRCCIFLFAWNTTLTFVYPRFYYVFLFPLANIPIFYPSLNMWRNIRTSPFITPVVRHSQDKQSYAIKSTPYCIIYTKCTISQKLPRYNNVRFWVCISVTIWYGYVCFWITLGSRYYSHIETNKLYFLKRCLMLQNVLHCQWLYLQVFLFLPIKC